MKNKKAGKVFSLFVCPKMQYEGGKYNIETKTNKAKKRKQSRNKSKNKKTGSRAKE